LAARIAPRVRSRRHEDAESFALADRVAVLEDARVRVAYRSEDIVIWPAES
jgi:ABC-type proline/glycine betaine transport system ATPase subunit